jgi:pimeloyl-ACP methyl ester carboxylesterase
MRMTINRFLKSIKPEERLEAMIEKLSPADRDLLSRPEIRSVMFESMALARRQGGEGIIFDIKSCAAPWPVDFSLIRCPYTLWHGLEDKVLPYTLSEFLHAKVAHSRLKLFPGEGHYSLPFKFTDEILTDLTARK